MPGYLDDLFPSHNCNHCGGHWVMLEDYLQWREHADDKDLELVEGVSVNEEQDEAQETKRALLCPVTGSIMLKYRISKDTSHRIDLSPSINGIWLDKGEWQLLKSNHLAGSLNKIFTAPWQRNIKEQNAAQVLEGRYQEQFGDEDYAKLKEIRNWLEDKKNRNLMVAYLAAKEPYSAIR
jgi:Zn-finger nucleic acid-binding protein